MITDTITLRPRYSEVDRMGYVYHANYITYCHSARTELLRKLGIEDSKLEEGGIMLPVIEVNARYRKPAHYDEILRIRTTIRELPKIKFTFYFEVLNPDEELVATATSTLVFADSQTRKPLRVPEFVTRILSDKFKPSHT